jgi:FkbM family methyltransferase
MNPRAGLLRLKREAYHAYQSRRVLRTVKRFESRTVEHDYAGQRLRVALEDPVGENWYDKDWPELAEIVFLGGHGLAPGATVFDIGAHQGIVAMLLARAVAPGNVFAIEAVPHNARVAERNLALNDIVNVTIENVAISDRDGELYVPWDLNAHVSNTAGAGLVAVSATTLDTLAQRHGAPDVVFVDVEGYELRALAGARHVLTHIRPSWFIEVHVGVGLEDAGGSAGVVIAVLEDAGYLTFGAPIDASSPFRPIARDDPLTARHFYLVALPAPPAPPSQASSSS